MKAIVLGGTGAVGKELITQLSQRDDIHHIIVISRRDVNISATFPDAKSDTITITPIQFENLESELQNIIPKQSLAFMTLGTTQNIAGSKARFKTIDYGYALSFAKACKQNHVKSLGVLTALGANPNSLSFYTKTKGEIERDISALNINSVYFFRPSLLLGRPKDGRLKEIWAERLLTPIQNLIPQSKRPVHIAQVAAAMIKALTHAPSLSEKRIHIMNNKDILSINKK